MSEIKLDVDLNELFKLSYDFDNLKSAIGQILKALQANTKTCNDMKKTVDNQNNEIKMYVVLWFTRLRQLDQFVSSCPCHR